jgi:hypothetical protein
LYLLHLDDSGKTHGSRDRYFALGGLATHEEDAYPLARSVDAVATRRLPVGERGLELHASDMWSGRKEWARIDEATRRALIVDVMRFISGWQAPSGRRPVLFAVAVNRNSFPGDVGERAHEELFARFDEFITRLHHRGESHRSIVIADDSAYERAMQAVMPRWKAVGTRMGRLHSIAEVPLFVSSRASRLVQLADFVAWGVWHYYESGITQHIAHLNPRFDADSGVQHGLTHLVRGYQYCGCVPCTSRRTGIIAVDIAPYSVVRPLAKTRGA